MKSYVIFLLVLFVLPAYADTEPALGPVPVLCIHGIDQTVNSLRPLRKVLLENGFHSEVVDFYPKHGESSLREIAEQISRAAEELKLKTKSNKIDVVAFSMGALAARHFIQRLKGKEYVRRFVSISGPQQGTYAGYLRYIHQGVKDMVPGSDFLLDLQRDKDPFGSVEVHAFYTPYDLIVFPGHSAVIEGAKQVLQFPVLMHHLMLKDKDVLRAVVGALKA